MQDSFQCNYFAFYFVFVGHLRSSTVGKREQNLSSTHCIHINFPSGWRPVWWSADTVRFPPPNGVQNINETTEHGPNLHADESARVSVCSLY